MRRTLAVLLVGSIGVLTWLVMASHGREAALEREIGRLRLDAATQLAAKLDEQRAQLQGFHEALQAERAGHLEERAWREARFPRPGTTDCVLYLPGRFPKAPPQPVHEGSVLAADAERNVYVISLGTEDGVEEGFVYIVSRDGAYVGLLTIDDVQARQSAGRLEQDMSKGTPRRNDKVLNGG
jgi:hypothetical protein